MVMEPAGIFILLNLLLCLNMEIIMITEISTLVYEVIELCCGLKKNQPRLPEECEEYKEEISISSVNNIRNVENN